MSKRYQIIFSDDQAEDFERKCFEQHQNASQMVRDAMEVYFRTQGWRWSPWVDTRFRPDGKSESETQS